MEDKKSCQVQEFSAIRGFYEKYTQIIEKTIFLMLKFLHIFKNLKKEI